MDITKKLISFICSNSYGDYQPEIVESTKKNVMNILGVILGGSSEVASKKIAGMVKEWDGKPESIIIAYDGKVPAHEAALVNGTMA
jgi:2-methylcitrate dehydratase PrpD